LLQRFDALVHGVQEGSSRRHTTEFQEEVEQEADTLLVMAEALFSPA